MRGRATIGETVPAKLASIATDVTHILYLSRSYTQAIEQWGTRNPGSDKDNFQVQAGIIGLMNGTSTLQVFENCVFKSPITLQLTFKDKTMNLTFLTPRVDDGAAGTAYFLVDSLPFKAGKFEITFTVAPGSKRLLDHSFLLLPRLEKGTEMNPL